MHYTADMFAIKSDLKEISRERKELGDASIYNMFSFPLMMLVIIELLVFFYFMLRIFVFRTKLFQEDIASNNGLETHQHGSSTGNDENCQNESLAHGMKNHQDFSVFGDMYWKLPLKCFRW